MGSRGQLELGPSEKNHVELGLVLVYFYNLNLLVRGKSLSLGGSLFLKIWGI